MPASGYFCFNYSTATDNLQGFFADKTAFFMKFIKQKIPFTYAPFLL